MKHTNPFVTIHLTPVELEAMNKLSDETELSHPSVLRQALRLYQMIHHRIMGGERVTFSGDEQRMIDFSGYGIRTPEQPDNSYAAAEEMLRDLISPGMISDTAIRVARDHMLCFARKNTV